MPKEQRIAEQRRARREADYQQVWELHSPCAGWLQQLLVRWGLVARQYFVTYVPPPSRNVKDAVTVVGAAYSTLTKTMFFSVGTMVVTTPYSCLGRFNRVVILAAMTQSLAMLVAFVKPKERNRGNDGVQLSNFHW